VLYKLEEGFGFMSSSMTYTSFTSVQNSNYSILNTVVMGTDPVHPITQETGKIESDVPDVELKQNKYQQT